MALRFGSTVPREGFGQGMALLVLAWLLLGTAACGFSGGDQGAAAADSADAETQADEGPAYSYEVVLRGMLRDTLRGGARYGLVFDPVTRREQWVLSMRSGGDVTSGLYLARPDTTRPSAGTYSIVSRRPVGRADSMRARGRETFTMIYRAGMRRSFRSQTGTLRLTTANDTLIEGTFEATLEGTAAPPGQPPREGTLTLNGTFRAEKRAVGFLFGV